MERPHEITRTASGAVASGFTPVHRCQGRLAILRKGTRESEIRNAAGDVVVATHVFDMDGAYDVRETDRLVVNGFLEHRIPPIVFDIRTVMHSSQDGRTQLYLEEHR